jgi:RNA polymerase sigma-70 factor (ECF subfamily)
MEMNEPLREQDLLDKFRALYKKYAPGLISYAAGLVGAVTAEDLVQDVFLKIWNRRSFLFWEEGLSNYLYNAVRHSCLDCLKRLQVKDRLESNELTRLKIEEMYYSETANLPWQDDKRLQSVYREIDALPGRCREIFVMAYLEERKITEIASLLNISRRTVEAQLYKGLKYIRKALQASACADPGIRVREE